MQTYGLSVSGRSIAADGDTTLVRTSEGVDNVAFRFSDEEWLDFDVSAAFSIDGVLEEVPLELLAADGELAAEASCSVPDSLLAHEGPLAVTVHGSDSEGRHIITAAAWPLSVEAEGDGEGDGPQPNPS